jgi:glycosyltransferase involved in cell wall biosynthesis
MELLRIAIVQRYFPHYRAALFDQLSTQDGLVVDLYCHPLNEPLFDEGIAIPVTGRRYVRAAHITRGWGPLRPLSFQWRALRQCVLGQYDLVVVEGRLTTATNVAIALIRSVTGRKTVVWHKGYFRHRREFDGLSGLARRLWCRAGSHTFCYGETTLDQLVKLGMESGRASVLYNTIELDHILQKPSRAESDEKANDLVLLYLGRLSSEKRVDVLLEAFLRIARGHPGLRLEIAGDGPLRSVLEARVQESEFAGRVQLHGRVSETEAQRLFEAGHICAFPGAVGLTVNEAMAAGMAVLVADEDGPDSEAVVHNVTGWRVAPGSVDDWVNALTTMIHDGPLRSRLGSEARAAISATWRMSQMVERFNQGIRTAAK